MEQRKAPHGKKQGAPPWRLPWRGSLKKAATYSPALRCSTIGAPGLNFSVRDGIEVEHRGQIHLTVSFTESCHAAKCGLKGPCVP